MDNNVMPNGSVLSRKKKFDFSSLTVIALTAVMFVIMSLLSDTFFTYSNIYAIFFGVCFQFLAAIGFTLLLIMGELDLSIGSIYAFSGMFVGEMMIKQKIPLVPAVLISLIVCAIIGLITGYLIVKLRLNSMMVTIATQTLMRGMASNFVKALNGCTYPKNMRQLAKARIGTQGFHYVFIITVILVIVLEFMLRKSAFFKKMYYVGENLETTRVYGIKSDLIKTAIFGVSSATAAIGGILASARVTYADTTLGNGLEFTVLTACVLGGASLNGGKGSLLSTFFGLAFLATINNALIIFGIDPLLSSMIVGVILIFTVFIDGKINKD